MNYPGGKNGAGTWQKIINQMPPHRVYAELFLGSGAVLRNKRPAPVKNFGCDLNPDCVLAAQVWYERTAPPEPFTFEVADSMELLRSCVMTQPGTLLYLDPPYLMSTRRAGRQLYCHELYREDQHAELLELVLRLPCLVLLSGYWSELYAGRLKDWRAISFVSGTRGGPATEWLWMNYPEPTELHDYRFLGENRRQRQDHRRKVARWRAKLEKMPSVQRLALMQALQELRPLESPAVDRDGETACAPAESAEALRQRILSIWRRDRATADAPPLD
jgi:DNA adenine methylase